MAYSVKKKEFYAYIYRKYRRTCPSTKTESTKFFLFAVVFFFLSVLFLTVLFLVCFFPPPLFFLFFVLYTMAFLQFPPSTCGSGGGSPFFLLLLPFLESSILNCKAACSLFRHHLHINAARGLVGQHLMWRQQYPQIFVFLSLLSFIWYFPIYFVARFVRGVTLRDW